MWPRRPGQSLLRPDKADRLVDADTFDKAVNHPPSLLQGWGGTGSAGASLVRATQNSTTFNGGISLERSTPRVDWLPPRSRSSIDYNQTFGTVTQPQTATTAYSQVKTNIFHAEAERDQYFSRRAYGFGSVTFDHNFSNCWICSRPMAAVWVSRCSRVRSGRLISRATFIMRNRNSYRQM